MCSSTTSPGSCAECLSVRDSGSGAYRVQPVHVEDLARICTDAGTTVETAECWTPPDRETMAFAELVALVRRATGARAPIVDVPAPVMQLAARALGTARARRRAHD